MEFTHEETKTDRNALKRVKTKHKNRDTRKMFKYVFIIHVDLIIQNNDLWLHKLKSALMFLFYRLIAYNNTS